MGTKSVEKKVTMVLQHSDDATSHDEAKPAGLQGVSKLLATYGDAPTAKPP